MITKRDKAILAVACVGACCFSAFDIAYGDLVAHWKFDETGGGIASDQGANGYDGTLYGDVLPRFVSGKSGNAIEISALKNQYVRVDTLKVDLLREFSVSAWIRTTTTTTGTVRGAAGMASRMQARRSRVGSNWSLSERQCARAPASTVARR